MTNGTGSLLPFVFVPTHPLRDNPFMSDLYSLFPSRIVMYTTEVCSDCRRAKAFFEARHISFVQVGIEGDKRATRFVAEINHGFHSVPTIVFPDGSILVEPTWDELQAKFN
jgi:mycoredoxin